MASRIHYRIIVTFTYKNGESGGVLDTTVNSKKAVDVQMETNRKWLANKGHTTNTVVIQPVN